MGIKRKSPIEDDKNVVFENKLKDLGLTKRKFGEFAGISESTVRSWFNSAIVTQVPNYAIRLLEYYELKQKCAELKEKAEKFDKIEESYFKKEDR